MMIMDKKDNLPMHSLPQPFLQHLWFDLHIESSQQLFSVITHQPNKLVLSTGHSFRIGIGSSIVFIVIGI